MGYNTIESVVCNAARMQCFSIHGMSEQHTVDLCFEWKVAQWESLCKLTRNGCAGWKCHDRGPTVGPGHEAVVTEGPCSQTKRGEPNTMQQQADHAIVALSMHDGYLSDPATSKATRVQLQLELLDFPKGWLCVGICLHT